MSSERKSKFQTLVEGYEDYLKENAFPSLSNLRPPVAGTTQTAVTSAIDQDPTVLAAKEKVTTQINGGQAPVANPAQGIPVPGAATNPTVQDPQLTDAIENHPDVIAAKKKVADAISLQQKRPANTITNP